MANDEQNAGHAANPSSRMRLADKFQKIKNGINLHHYSEFGEEKGDRTQIVEAEHGGKIVGRFVSKNGELVESHGSEDSQAAGTHAQIAKKLGVADDIVHTKPEQVSEIAHEERQDSVKNKDNQTAKNVTKPTSEHKLDNCAQVEKVKFPGGDPKAMKQKEPLDKALPHVHYSTGDKSESYDRGGAPVPAPTAKSTEPLRKKWQVFMDSCTGKFRDPLQKEPSKLVKSLQNMVEILRKADVSYYKEERPKHPVKSAYEPAKEKAAKDKMDGKKKLLTEDEHGVKYWSEVRKQHKQIRRREEGEKIPKPGEAPKAPKNKVLDFKDKTKKSSVNQASKKPNQDAAKTPTIQNVSETTLATTPVGRNEGLAKAPVEPKKSPIIDPNVTPQHFPSAENGLEEHLTNLTEAYNKNANLLESASHKENYGKDMTTAERDKQIKMAQRSLQYLKNGIDLTKVAIQSRDSKNPNWNDLLGMGNPKVNQMGIITFGNTLPGHNCPARGGCGDGSCYGMNGQQAMGNALQLRARNAGLIHRPDFVQGAIQAIRNAPKHMTVSTAEDMYEAIKDHPRFKSILMNEPVKTKDGLIRFKVKAGDVFRWHDTGDILNEKHLNDMVTIAKTFPEKKFYAYTKSMHLPLDKLRALPNFNVVQSLGGEHNDKIDTSKPHAKFFDSLEHAEGAGYSPVWFHDWPAASGVTNIALVPHGSRQKEVNVDEFNKGAAEAPKPTEIKKSSKPSHEPAWLQFDQPDSIAQSAAMGVKGKMRAMSMLMHKHDEPIAPMQKGDVVDIKTKKAPATKIEIQPHPPEVIDVDPKIISDMKSRLAPKEPIKKGDVINMKSKLLPKQMEANRTSLQNRATTHEDEFSSAEKKMKQGLSYDVALNSSKYDNQPGNPVINMILASKKKKDDIKKNGDDTGATIHQINEATKKRPAQVLNFMNEWNKRKDQRTIEIQKRRAAIKPVK